MKPMMTQVKDNAGLLSILAGLLVIAGSFSQLEKLAWLIQVPNVAYAGQAVAEETKDKFERYLEKQEAYTEALQDYVQQQMPNQRASVQRPPIPQLETFIEIDPDGNSWCCKSTSYDECWQEDRNGQNQWWRCDPERQNL